MRKLIKTIKYYFEFMLQEIFTWWMLRNHKKMIESSRREREKYGPPVLTDPKDIPLLGFSTTDGDGKPRFKKKN